jgi:hypothetical protein
MAGIECDLGMSESEGDQASADMCLVADAVASLLRRRAVIAKTFGLDD